MSDQHFQKVKSGSGTGPVSQRVGDGPATTVGRGR